MMNMPLLRSRLSQVSAQTAKRLFSTTNTRNVDFTHAVIGGGAVGLAIARELASREGTSTLLIERHGSVGTETSSRNSEVIHAGLYYGPGSLKTKLCIKGKHMLYDLCEKQKIPYRNTKKWIMAQDDAQMRELEKIHEFAKSVDVPTDFLSRKEIEEREPDVRAQAGVLESPTTGIVDSHSLMAFLEGDFQEKGGECVFHTSVNRIEPLGKDGEEGYRLYTTTYEDDPNSTTSTAGESGEPEESMIEVSTLINSAGLHAIPLSNSLLPKSAYIQPFYAKGSYFSYSAPRPKPTTLLYPAPVPGHGGLGTHLTLDLQGRIRFGPDVEWVDSPDNLQPNMARLAEAIDAIAEYLPSINREEINLDYCGIRPKLGKTSGTAGKDFADFYIREESSNGRKGFVNLLGIESPGLTSSLAIGEMVREILYGISGGSEKI